MGRAAGPAGVNNSARLASHPLAAAARLPPAKRGRLT